MEQSDDLEPGMVAAEGCGEADPDHARLRALNNARLKRQNAWRCTRLFSDSIFAAEASPYLSAQNLGARANYVGMLMVALAALGLAWSSFGHNDVLTGCSSQGQPTASIVRETLRGCGIHALLAGAAVVAMGRLLLRISTLVAAARQVRHRGKAAEDEVGVLVATVNGVAWVSLVCTCTLVVINAGLSTWSRSLLPAVYADWFSLRLDLVMVLALLAAYLSVRTVKFTALMMQGLARGSADTRNRLDWRALGVSLLLFGVHAAAMSYELLWLRCGWFLRLLLRVAHPVAAGLAIYVGGSLALVSEREGERGREREGGERKSKRERECVCVSV